MLPTVAAAAAIALVLPAAPSSIHHACTASAAAPVCAPPTMPSIFPPPTTELYAFIQPPGLGAPKASQANPGGAGNAEGNWWTPSSVDPKDQQKKVAEIRARQVIAERNGAYKVEKMRQAEEQAAAKAAAKAQRQAEIRAQREKYAARR